MWRNYESGGTHRPVRAGNFPVNAADFPVTSGTGKVPLKILIYQWKYGNILQHNREKPARKNYQGIAVKNWEIRERIGARSSVCFSADPAHTCARSVRMARSPLHRIRIGTAGWSLYKAEGERFPADGNTLEWYAAAFDAVEINSSFHRPHKQATYMRWAASVPAAFRFAVKLPKTITHKQRLIDCEDLLARFADEVGGLGKKRGPVLIQLPPKLAFDAHVAEGFFGRAAALLGGQLVCEPRHRDWFTPLADALLVAHQVARVAADPAPVPEAAEPGGWRGLRYTRLHGSPRIYWSDYDPAAIGRHADAARTAKVESWTIYDNTASGAALRNALAMLDRVAAARG